jgi:acyl carrier protein
MKTEEFLKRVAEALEYDGEITSNQDTLTIDGWDSLGVLSIMELLSDLDVKYDVEKLGQISNISELLETASEILNRN